MTYIRHKRIRKRNGEEVWIKQVISDFLGLYGKPKINISNTPLYEIEEKSDFIGPGSDYRGSDKPKVCGTGLVNEVDYGVPDKLGKPDYRVPDKLEKSDYLGNKFKEYLDKGKSLVRFALGYDSENKLAYGYVSNNGTIPRVMPLRRIK